MADIPSRRNRLTTLSTAGGKLLHLEYHAAEPALVQLARDLGQSGKRDTTAFVTTERQNRAAGGLVLLPKKENVLSLSLLLFPLMNVSRSGILRAAAAVAACRVLTHTSSFHPRIVFPGAVQSEDRDVAAFHLEGTLEEDGFWRYLVLSVAFSLEPEYYTEALSDVVMRVFTNRSSDVADQVTEEFLSEFFALYESPAPEVLAEEYNRLATFVGKRARALVTEAPSADGKRPEKKLVAGRLLGLDRDGRMVLEGKTGRYAINDLSQLKLL